MAVLLLEDRTGGGQREKRAHQPLGFTMFIVLELRFCGLLAALRLCACKIDRLDPVLKPLLPAF